MTRQPLNAVFGTTVLIAIGFAAGAQGQTDRFDALANAPMTENRPTPETTKLLKDELLFQRATQTYLWALPLIMNWRMIRTARAVFSASART